MLYSEFLRLLKRNHHQKMLKNGFSRPQLLPTSRGLMILLLLRRRGGGKITTRHHIQQTITPLTVSHFLVPLLIKPISKMFS